MKVAVIGAGVIGLSTALRILQKLPDVEMTIFADKFTPDTTGDGAAGFWEPSKIGDTPAELCLKWGKATYDHLLSIIKTGDATKLGVELISGYYFFPKQKEDPDWKDACLGFRKVTRREIDLFAPEAKDGFFFTSVICSAKKYLPWMMNELRRLNCVIVKEKIESFSRLAEYYDVAVNCTGIGSTELTEDVELLPLQGQLVTVKNITQKMFFVMNDEPYNINIFPRADEVVLGGTAFPGKWSEKPDPGIQRGILKRASKLVPDITNSVVVNSWVGLRPFRRKGVRIERETMRFGPHKLEVIHNYGHGGGGISLHWGCAEDATWLVGECQRAVLKSNL
ncbi:D-aspartate oxidase-like isoform X2 [Apostichopus japonicus]